MKQRYIALFAILLIFTIGCYFYYNRESPSAHFDKHIVDAIHLKAPNAFFEQADAYKYAQDYRRALTAFEKLLPQSKTAEDSLYAYNQLAYIALAMNEDSAAAQYIRTIEVHFPLVDKSTPSVSGDYFYNRGVLAYRVFHPKEAEKYLKAALGLYQKIYTLGHLKEGLCLMQLGFLFYEFAQNPDSTFIYIPKAYDFFQSTHLKQYKNASIEFCRALYCLPNRTFEIGIAHCDNALEIAYHSPFKDSLLIARNLCLKGCLLKKKAENELDIQRKKMFYQQAEKQYKSAISIARPLNTIRLQEIYAEFAFYYMHQLDSANVFYCISEIEKLLKTQVDRYGKPDRLSGYFSYKMAVDFESKNDSIKSRYYYEHSIVCYQKFWSIYSRDSTRSITAEEPSAMMYRAYTQLHQHDDALKKLKEMLVIFTDYEGKTLSDDEILSPKVFGAYQRKPFAFVRLGWLANCFLNKYKYKNQKDINALKKALKVFKLTDDLLFSGIIATDEDAVIVYQKEVAEQICSDALETAYLLNKHTHDKQYINDAFRFMDRSKSFLLFRNKIIDSLSLDMPPKQLLDSMNLLTSKINQLKWESEKGQLDSENLTHNEQKLHDIFEQIKKGYPDYYRAKVIQPISTIEEVQKKIGDKQLVIQYSISNTQLYICMISRKETVFHRVPWDSIAIKELQSYRAYLSDDSQTITVQQFQKTAAALYNILLGKLKLLHSDIHEFIIIPDRILHLIPFEALVEQLKKNQMINKFKDLPYLICRFQITYSPSWKIYQNNCQAKLSNKPNILACTYDTLSGELPYAKEEITAIKSVYGDSLTLLYGDGCTKQAFLNQHRQFDIIHLSLHAASSRSIKQDNKIWFAPHRKDMLYGFELLNKSFKARLIVLSACQTAYGATEAGEGTFSLSRAFLQAGANQVIASLWKVDDASTAELIPTFYQTLSKNQTTATALQMAKIKLIHQANQVSNPKFWAGLVLID